MSPAERRGVLVIVSSPSGAGKTTLTRRLLGEFPNLTFSVSYTTRSIRPGERDGVDYHFVDASTFEGMVERGEFAEHATVHGNNYGTAKAPVDEALRAGRDVIFDVDWQGGRALSAQWPDDSLRVFILPPDLETLAQRLRRRATDAPEVIERRLRKAIEELGHFGEYENLIVNDELDRAYGVLRAVYLCRSYGEPLVDGRPGVPFPLGQLAAVIAANLDTGPDAHARALIAARS
jgi:guanylate kinase